MSFIDRYNGDYSCLINDLIEITAEEENMALSHVKTCFEKLNITSISDGKINIYTKSNFIYNMIKDKYVPTLEKYLSVLLGENFSVSIYTDSISQMSDIENGASHKIENPIDKLTVNPASGTADNETDDLSERDISIPISANNYTFDNFIVGSSNQLARAACYAVSNNPAKDYNPLFIYGQSGLGKTHLLWAIINNAKKVDPDVNIIYVRGEDFTNQLIDSIHHSKQTAFRNRYRKADIFLIDDIQFIAGKDSTQEEFFHTFNTLYEEGKQIIMTSDRPPHEIKTLQDRLKTRFEWGLMADIQVPDYELRVAIIKSKLELLHISMPADAIEVLATNLTSNVRQLEGAIKRLGANALLSGKKITVDDAVKCVSELIPTGSEPMGVTVNRIYDAVSARTGISVEDIKGRKRQKDIAFARHISVYLIRKLTNMSLPAIGRELSRDHTTIISSLNFVESEIENNGSTARLIEDIQKELR